MLETTHLRPHLDELSEKKFSLLSIELDFARKLLQNAKSRLQMQQFRDAKLVATQKVDSLVRNDRIFWLDAKSKDLTDIENQFLVKLESIKIQLKNELRISLSEFECHYAFYPTGHFYQRHRDTKTNDNKRILSFVLYLNENWNVDQGGELVGYDGDQVLFTVLPEMGNLILFQSELEHEVRPTYRDRFSLTGWFRC